MKKLILAATLLLAACGGEDFSVDANVPAERAFATLSSLDGRMLTSTIGLPAVRREKTGEGEFRFIVPSGDNLGDATIAFRVEALDGSRSRIHVDLDMPDVVVKVGGFEKVLNETKAEWLLRSKLNAWASARAKGGSGNEEAFVLNQVIGAFALAMTPSKLNDTGALAAAGEALSDFMAANSEDAMLAYGDGDGPMSNPEEGAARSLDGVDEAEGAAANGAEIETADTTPDNEIDPNYETMEIDGY